jgi:hypothetical protein
MCVILFLAKDIELENGDVRAPFVTTFVQKKKKGLFDHLVSSLEVSTISK